MTASHDQGKGTKTYEEVTEVTATCSAGDFDTSHSEGGVGMLRDCSGDGLRKERRVSQSAGSR